MKFIENTITLVINGDFNLMYTRPEWFAKKLFEEKEIQVFTNNLGSGELTFAKNNVYITPSINKLTLRIATEELFSEMLNLTNKYLRVTASPMIYSFGINFNFINENTTIAKKLNNAFDYNELCDAEINIKSTAFKRTIFEEGKDYIINYEALNKGEESIIKVNCHFEKQKPYTEIGDFEKDIQSAFNETKELFEKIYKVKD